MKLNGKALSAMLLAGMAATAWAQAGPRMSASEVPSAQRARPASDAKAPAGTISKPEGNRPPASSPAAKPNVETAGPMAANSPFVPKGKRDPFSSVIQTRTAGAPCMAGRKCLVAEHIVLKGVVKGPDGMLAVVENQQRKAYFLRENDPVFNGQVLRITPDSIVFREKVLDDLGHEKTREVVKRIAGVKPIV